MRLPYQPDPQAYIHYYTEKAGGQVPIFFGRYQCGGGLGSFFKSLLRLATPLLRRGGCMLGREALKATTEVAGDILAGQKLKNSVQDRLKEIGKIFASEALSSVQHGGGGIKRKRTTCMAQSTSRSQSRQSVPKKKKTKKKRTLRRLTDIFD